MHFIFVVPAPNVTIAALNSQIINGSLLLRCDVTTVVGIGRSVDIVWMKEDGEILRENDTKGEPISNASLMLYTSYYFNNITTLQMINDNDVYYCQAIINTNPLVTNSDSYTLNVIGKYNMLTLFSSTYTYVTVFVKTSCSLVHTIRKLKLFFSPACTYVQ